MVLLSLMTDRGVRTHCILKCLKLVQLACGEINDKIVAVVKERISCVWRQNSVCDNESTYTCDECNYP